MSETTYEPIPENLDMPATKGDLKLTFASLDSKIENIPTKAEFSQLLTSVDGLAKQVKVYNEERASEGARLERIEAWIKKAASAINVPIEF